MKKKEYWLIHEIDNGERYIDVFECPKKFENFKELLIKKAKKITLWEEHCRTLENDYPRNVEILNKTIPFH